MASTTSGNYSRVGTTVGSRPTSRQVSAVGARHPTDASVPPATKSARRSSSTGLCCLINCALGSTGSMMEQRRRLRVVDELERFRKLAPGRKVRIQVPSSASDTRRTDLPAGVHLRPGELRIEFLAPRACCDNYSNFASHLK